MLKKFLGLSMFIGFLLMIGTAGSSDLGLISFERLVIRMCLGIIMITGGYIGLKLSNWEYID